MPPNKRYVQFLQIPELVATAKIIQQQIVRQRGFVVDDEPAFGGLNPDNHAASLNTGLSRIYMNVTNDVKLHVIWLLDTFITRESLGEALLPFVDKHKDNYIEPLPEGQEPPSALWVQQMQTNAILKHMRQQVSTHYMFVFLHENAINESVENFIYASLVRMPRPRPVEFYSLLDLQLWPVNHVSVPVYERLGKEAVENLGVSVADIPIVRTNRRMTRDKSPQYHADPQIKFNGWYTDDVVRYVRVTGMDNQPNLPMYRRVVDVRPLGAFVEDTTYKRPAQIQEALARKEQRAKLTARRKQAAAATRAAAATAKKKRGKKPKLRHGDGNDSSDMEGEEEEPTTEEEPPGEDLGSEDSDDEDLRGMHSAHGKTDRSDYESDESDNEEPEDFGENSDFEGGGSNGDESNSEERDDDDDNDSDDAGYY